MSSAVPSSREQVSALVLAARTAAGLSWQALADAIGRPVLWTTAALLGQHPIGADDAAVLVGLLGLPSEVIPILGSVPRRGLDRDSAAQDPTIYRFYEALAVYGPALKEVIHEQFGDGIMSAINFSVSLERKAHPGEDRVVVTFDGKFLPYDWVS